MKLKLQYPITAAGATLSEVTIERAVTARDLVIVGGQLDEDDTYFRATANALGIAPKDFDEIDFEDLEEINAKLEELANHAPDIPEGFDIRRPKGRDVIDVKRDRTAKNLAKVIARLSGKSEDDILALNINQFSALAGKVSDFIGRRASK